MSKKGGYVIVDLKGQSITAGTPFTLDGVTARLDRAKNKACLLSGFAIGNDEKRDVFVDLQKTEDGYVALFGQYTITIEDDEVTIAEGGVLMDDIVDSQGHKRFIEGNGVTTTISGVTYSYSKWSLSGTHLMCVLAGSIGNAVTVSRGSVLATYDIPSWVADKIVPTFATYVEQKAQLLINDDGTSQETSIRFQITAEKKLRIVLSPLDLTTTAERNFRIQFDLLIDTATE